MTFVPPVPPIEAATALGPAGPVGAATAPGPVSPELRHRFESLMQRHEKEVEAESGAKGPTALGGMIDKQQSELNEVQARMTDFIEHMPSMDPLERTATTMTLMEQVSDMHVKMSLTMGVTKASTKSLQSLLKNE